MPTLQPTPITTQPKSEVRSHPMRNVQPSTSARPAAQTRRHATRSKAPARPGTDPRRVGVDGLATTGHVDVPNLPVPVDGSLRIAVWQNAFLDASGHDVHSSYVELFWLPVLGPSSTFLLRRLTSGLKRFPNGYQLPVIDTARSLGLGVPSSRQSHFVRALHRCVVFHAARFVGPVLEVRPRLATLQPSQVERLPESLQIAHAQVVAEMSPPDQARAASFDAGNDVGRPGRF